MYAQYVTWGLMGAGLLLGAARLLFAYRSRGRSKGAGERKTFMIVYRSEPPKRGPTTPTSN